jgi:hypothetical protein
MGKGQAASEKVNPTAQDPDAEPEKSDKPKSIRNPSLALDNPPRKPHKETAATRYQTALAERRRLNQPAYVKTLLWGIEPAEEMHRKRPSPQHKRYNEEVHDGRRNILGTSSVVHGKLVYFARRPSADLLGKDGMDPHHYLPQPKSVNFSMLLVGTLLHYMVLFFYFGALGMYETFSSGGRDEYISVAPPEGQPDWAPSTKTYIAKKYAARGYVRDYFDEAWRAMMGIVFGFQFAMCIYHIGFNHHRKGRWARGIRALLGLDCLFEFFVCLKRRDITPEYRTLRRLEMVFRGLPLATYMSSICMRFYSVYTDAEKSTLLAAIYMSIFSAVITCVDCMAGLKPSSFIRIALKSYGWFARICVIGFCLTSAMMRICTFAAYSVALETKVYEALIVILVCRGFFYAVFELLDTFGHHDMDRVTKLFKKVPRAEIVPKVERDKLSFMKMQGPALFLQAWVFGMFWSMQSIFIDMPVFDMKAGKFYAGFLPVAAQVMLTTVETFSAFDAMCSNSMHPLPVHFGCTCTESKRDRSADLQCTGEHASPTVLGQLRNQISVLYGLHITFLCLMALLSRRRLKRKAIQIDAIDQEEIDVENATVYPSTDTPVDVASGDSEGEYDEFDDGDENESALVTAISSSEYGGSESESGSGSGSESDG